MTYNGLVNGETASVLSGTLGYGGISQGAVNAGTYAITPSGLSSGNYAISYTNGNLVTNPKLLAVSIIGTPTKTYDGNTSALLSSSDYGLSGVISGESIAINQTSGSYSSPNVNTNIPVNAVLDSDNYTPVSNTLLSNYELPTSASGTGQITQATLQIRASDQSKIYGNTLNFNGSEFTSAGLVVGETVVTVDLASAGSDALANVAGSPYSITASNASGSFNPDNYAITYKDGLLTVTPAQLTATANNAVRTYNNTAFTGGNGVTYNGIVNGDFLENVVSGTAAYGGDSQNAVNAGTYTIALSGLSSTSTNYSLGFFNGTLVINPKLLAVSIINTPTKVYEGNASANLTSSNYSITGLVNTDKVTINQTYGSYNSQHVSLANKVEATLSSSNIVAGTGTIGTNYLLPTQAFGAGRITPATLTYLADLRTLSFGSSIPTLTGTVTGFVGGDNLKNATTGTAVWNTTATNKSLPGKYAINGSGLTANYGDYKFVQAARNATALSIVCVTKICK